MKQPIKSLMTIFVAVSMVLCFTGTVLAWTFDSEINPEEFNKWERISSVRTSSFGGVVTLKNPDPNAKVKEANLDIYDDCLISYWYTIDGKVYTYEFNDETENYGLVVPEAPLKK